MHGDVWLVGRAHMLCGTQRKAHVLWIVGAHLPCDGASIFEVDHLDLLRRPQHDDSRVIAMKRLHREQPLRRNQLDEQSARLEGLNDRRQTLHLDCDAERQFVDPRREIGGHVFGGERDLDRRATQQITLRAGWNEVRFRGYCYGYNPFRVGLVLKAAEKNLWPLKLSATPPALDRKGTSR